MVSFRYKLASDNFKTFVIQIDCLNLFGTQISNEYCTSGYSGGARSDAGNQKSNALSKNNTKHKG